MDRRSRRPNAYENSLAEKFSRRRGSLVENDPLSLRLCIKIEGSQNWEPSHAAPCHALH
jgi:hypothetical protein